MCLGGEPRTLGHTLVEATRIGNAQLPAHMLLLESDEGKLIGLVVAIARLSNLILACANFLDLLRPRLQAVRVEDSPAAHSGVERAGPFRLPTAQTSWTPLLFMESDGLTLAASKRQVLIVSAQFRGLLIFAATRELVSRWWNLLVNNLMSNVLAKANAKTGKTSLII